MKTAKIIGFIAAMLVVWTLGVAFGETYTIHQFSTITFDLPVTH
jgi:uncharacterized membrane protein